MRAPLRALGPVVPAVLLFLAAATAPAQTVPPTPPLEWAATNGLVEIAALLIEKGAAVNATDSFGNTPLHVGIDHPAMVELLLASGAEVNARNAFGNTPLELAVRSPGPAELQVVQLLLAAGADVKIKNYLDKTALDYALRGGVSPYNLSVIQTLIRAGAGVP